MRSLRIMSITPFESAIATLLIITGISQLTRWGNGDVVLSAIPGWEAAIFGWATIFAGLFLCAGLAFENRRVEALGLFFVGGIFTGRFLIYGEFFGFLSSGFLQTGVFYAAIIVAAVVRWITVIRGDTIVRIRRGQVEYDPDE